MTAPLTAPSLAVRPLVGAIQGYQYVTAGRPAPCRFEPSGSAYADDALTAHGVIRGSWLTIRRLSRCHPWGGHGYDPVPPSPRGADR